jgi:DNA-binding HxlR family transcriptional regulator
MRTIKEASTNNQNKKSLMVACPVSYTLDKIGGRWKPIILWNLREGKKRYSELRKAIPTITEKMLIQHLKQLEADKLLIRKALPVVPPYVTYSLTESGMGLRPVLYAMAIWAVEDCEKNSTISYKNMGDFPAGD